MTVYAGRHRKTSTYNRGVHRIVASGVNPVVLNDGTLYVSLYDAATGNALGVDFEPRAIKRLRRVLDRLAA
jgi:hypothetical protein